jgi:MFS transporter, DHA2 family, methylenomycin A resistance protein
MRMLPLLAVSLGYFMVILDATIVTVALPALGRDLQADVAGLQGVVDAYAVVFAGLLLLGGTLSDRFGSRGVFPFALAAFTLASAACGLAPSLGALGVARAAQGVGAALTVPSSLALLGAAYPDPRQRARAFGLWGGIAGVAAASGPVLGGVLVASVSWRAVFLVNLPIGAVTLWLVRRHVTATSRREGARGLDPVGQLTALISLGGLVVALIQGGDARHEPPSLAGVALLPEALAVLGAAPADRGGLAAGVLNTGRQVGGAVGIALLGALVGGRPFATGMHLAMSAAAFAAGAALSWTTVG